MRRENRGYWRSGKPRDDLARISQMASLMKIALPIWDHRVSPVFDVAQQVLVVEVSPRGMRLQRCRSLPQTDPMARAQTLIDWGVEVLICGAISQALENLLKSQGVAIISRVRGEVAAVLEAYVAGRLDEPEFAMPGCHVATDSGGDIRSQPTYEAHPSGLMCRNQGVARPDDQSHRRS